MKQLFLKENVDISGLTDLIIKKNTGFSIVMKQESEEEDEEDVKDNDEEVYSVTSFVQLDGDFQVEPSIINFKEYLLRNTVNSAAINSTLKSNSNLYWVVNERFINLSPKISLPSFELILKDLAVTKRRIDTVVMVIKILKEEVKESKKSNKKSKGDGEVIYQNPEEEILFENCDHSVEFSVASQCDEDARNGYWDDDDTKYIPYRRFLLFSKGSFDKAIECLLKELNQ